MSSEKQETYDEVKARYLEFIEGFTELCYKHNVKLSSYTYDTKAFIVSSRDKHVLPINYGQEEDDPICFYIKWTNPAEFHYEDEPKGTDENWKIVKVTIEDEDEVIELNLNKGD